jgi:hypothetical protein
MKHLLKLFLLAIAITILTPVVQAQGNKYKNKNRDHNSNWGTSNNTIGRWELIGTQTVTKTSERDNFRPSNRSSFSALKVRAKQNTVTINRMTVVYENGQRQDIPIRRTMRDGEESMVIHLRQKRRIDRIEFHYKSKQLLGSRGQIQVWARR